jgi:hypothetical protein
MVQVYRRLEQDHCIGRNGLKHVLVGANHGICVMS